MQAEKVRLQRKQTRMAWERSNVRDVLYEFMYFMTRIIIRCL